MAVLLVVLMAACGKDFLEVDPKGQFLESNYYKNQEEAFNGLVAVYDVIGWQAGGYLTKIGTANCGSDDHLAGGGGPSDIMPYQVISDYSLSPEVGPQGEMWKKGFAGVFRANILLAKLPEVPMDDNLKKRFAAEARFLRAYFYFDLVRFFKSVPLLLEPVSASEMYNVEQTDAATVYAQIEKDINESLPDLPATVPASTEGGRATKAMAYGILGKVLLWQKKYAPAAAAFAEVSGTPGATGPFGHRLLSNFGDLFKVNNKFNAESVFEINFTNTSVGIWDCTGCTEGNLLQILVGPRGYNRLDQTAPDYVSGWSFMPITQSLVDAFGNDPRKAATVADIQALEDAGRVTYNKGHNNTGYFIEKLAGRESYKWTGAGNMELNFPLNMYELRLADLYLLEAEALLVGGGDQNRATALFNAVRDRAWGNDQHRLPLTLDNLKKERRLELAAEGHRYFDLIRWGDAPVVLKDKGFEAHRNEYLPIPLLEMENTRIQQISEWGGDK